MFAPDTGKLLLGARRALAETVLPSLTDPDAVRQLKAALHLLGRLSRTWDLPHGLIAADNADMIVVIAAIRARLGEPGEEANERLSPDLLSDAAINDPGLRELAVRNVALRTEVERLEQEVRSRASHDLKQDCLADLSGLFERMTRRASILAGDSMPVPESSDERGPNP